MEFNYGRLCLMAFLTMVVSETSEYSVSLRPVMNRCRRLNCSQVELSKRARCQISCGFPRTGKRLMTLVHNVRCRGNCTSDPQEHGKFVGKLQALPNDAKLQRVRRNDLDQKDNVDTSSSSSTVVTVSVTISITGGAGIGIVIAIYCYCCREPNRVTPNHHNMPPNQSSYPPPTNPPPY